MKLTKQELEKAWTVEFTPRPYETLLLVYPDGERRIFSVRQYLQKRNLNKGFYKKLYDEKFFNSVKSVQGMPDWGNGLFNISPEILLKESEPLEINQIFYLHEHKILIEFNGHQTHLLDMKDKFDSDAARKWEPLSKFCDIHFDENFIWWGDKESQESMIIHASTLYKISVSCEGKFSEVTSEPDWFIGEISDTLRELIFAIENIRDTAAVHLEDLTKNEKEMLKSEAFRLKKIKSIYKIVIKKIKPAHKKINKLLVLIEKGKLIYRYLLEFNRYDIQGFKFLVEKAIYNAVVPFAQDGSLDKEAYELMSKIDIEITKLIRQFNNAIYTYNKMHNTDISGFLFTIYSISRNINYRLVPHYLEDKIAGLVWDDWLSDISDKGEAARFICKIIFGGDKKSSAVSFYFLFENDSCVPFSNEPDAEICQNKAVFAFHHKVYQFKALFAYHHNDYEWFVKYYTPSDFERIKKVIHDIHDGSEVIDLLRMEKCERGNPLRRL